MINFNLTLSKLMQIESTTNGAMTEVINWHFYAFPLLTLFLKTLIGPEP